MTVSKKDIQTGKSGSFDGTDEEWLKIVVDALFSMGQQKDITLSASLNKAKDKITVTHHINDGVDRRLLYKELMRKSIRYLSLFMTWVVWDERR